jgi:chromate reductase, NAD(P)H dehydrogenase (quinone)
MAGTARAQLHLQNVLSEAGALVMVKPGVLVTFPWQKFDEVGRLIDEDTRTFLRRHLDSFAQWIQRVETPGEALVAQR